LTSDEIWLQQLVNFFLTVAAWAIVCVASRNRQIFAWLSFVTGAVFFSGYVYLFHLHGVFYAPLLLFISLLLLYQRGYFSFTWREAVAGMGLAVVAGMFHPFALLIFACYAVGAWLECVRNHRPARLGAAIVCVLVSIIASRLLLGHNSAGHKADYLRGWVLSFRMLEVNHIATLAGILLAAVAGLAIGSSWRNRVVFGFAALLSSIGLSLAGLPVLIGPIVFSLAAALFAGRFALAGLIVACATLPVATGTGSPTYAIFVLMPCLVAIADGFTSVPFAKFQQRASILVVLITAASCLALISGFHPSPVRKLMKPLMAEQEKTFQLKSVFTWLAANPAVSGRLSLCDAGGPPSQTDNALVRTFRAPVDKYSFDYYLQARFGERFKSGPPLYICFGGQRIPETKTLYSLNGGWAGPASVQSAVK
jgi:hypothetical protein